MIKFVSIINITLISTTNNHLHHCPNHLKMSIRFIFAFFIILFFKDSSSKDHHEKFLFRSRRSIYLYCLIVDVTRVAHVFLFCFSRKSWEKEFFLLSNLPINVAKSCRNFPGSSGSFSIFSIARFSKRARSHRQFGDYLSISSQGSTRNEICEVPMHWYKQNCFTHLSTKP